MHDLAHIHAVGGPAAAVPTAGPPLTIEQMEAIIEAIGIMETPDPALPSAWLSRPPASETTQAAWLDGVLNALVIAFLVWLFIIVVGPDRRTL